MTDQIPPEPKPPAEEYEGATEEQWSQWYSDIAAWRLLYKELPQVLSETELQEARALGNDELFDRYPAVADAGPRGGVWYNQLIAMRKLLQRNRFKPWVQHRFLEDFIQTHNLDSYPKWPEGQKPTLFDRADESGLIGAFWPDVDSYYDGTTIAYFFYYRPVWRYFKRKNKRGVQKVDTHWIGEVHCWTTALSELLAEFPHYDALRKAHDEFVARWDLPMENVPTAGNWMK